MENGNGGEEVMVDAVGHFRKESEGDEVFEEAIGNIVDGSVVVGPDLGLGSGLGPNDDGVGSMRPSHDDEVVLDKPLGEGVVVDEPLNEGVAVEKSLNEGLVVDKSLGEGLEVGGGETGVIDEDIVAGYPPSEGVVMENPLNEGVVEGETLVIEEPETRVVDEDVVAGTPSGKGVVVVDEDIVVGTPSVEGMAVNEDVETESMAVEVGETGVIDEDIVEKLIVVENSQNDKDVKDIAEDSAPPEVTVPISQVKDAQNPSTQNADGGGNIDSLVVSKDHSTPTPPSVDKPLSSDETAPAGKNSASSSTDSSDPPARPAGLGRAALGPAPRASQPRSNTQLTQPQSTLIEEPTNGEVEEGDEIREKLQMIRVKFLRLAHRLGQTPHNVVVAQVLYRLGLAEQLRARNGGRVGAFSFDRASAMAEQLESSGTHPLDFSCTIMVIGKTGVGKSATINSIFDEVKFSTDPFQLGTKKVQDVVGTVQGIKLRVIDTPGLLPSCTDQRYNERILHSVKRFIKKSPPDIVLYLDRLDMPSRDFTDMPLLKTITEIFGTSIWFNAIVVLTHAASAPPEGPNGTVSTYDMFVTQRSHAVQQAIRQAAGDMRLMNPVSLVENHSLCRTNRAGQRVLPNGQVWKPHLLLLSFASKILAEANTLLKLQDAPPGGKVFGGAHSRAPSLPLLLSSLLQSRPQIRLPRDQFGGDDDAIDDVIDESSDSDDETEYDELPPFKPLTKAELSELSGAHRKAYYDELEFREKLFMKKQLKEEKRRRKMMKKMEEEEEGNDQNTPSESEPASLPVPMPDLPLPASFDSDNPTHRYRCLDTSNQWLVRPNLDSHGWDHDVGYEGLNIERMFAVKDTLPISLTGQLTKDKKEANLQLEVATSLKHGQNGKSTTMGFDLQSVGKELAYTIRSETKFINHKHNKATTGFSATVLGDSFSGGLKFEDKLIINKQSRFVLCGGAMVGRDDVAYGGSLEASFRDRDYPVGRFLTSLLLTVMDWHGELAIGGNFQTQVPLSRGGTLVGRASLNNRGSGNVSLRVTSTEQVVLLAMFGIVPFVRRVVGYQEH